MPLPHPVVALLERVLPAHLVEPVVGDLEEAWADRRAFRLLAWGRLLASTAGIVWAAARSRRAPLDGERSRQSLMSHLLQDIRFACRLAVRQPFVSAAAFVTLALGIGATTALYAVVHAWVLEPLPFRDSARLVMAWETIPSASIFENTPAPATLQAWRAGAPSFAALEPWTLQIVNLTGDGDPLQLTAAVVSRGLLPLVGVSPVLGRNFVEEEMTPNGPAAAILTHALWTTRFAASPDVVGRSVTISGRPVTIVGVLPREMTLLDLGVDIWVPLAQTAAEQGSRNRIFWVMGRLAAGATVERAGRELDAIMRQQSDGALGARVVSLQQQTVGPLGRDVVMLFAATGCILLIACANVASLTLARIIGRRTELVLRSALGAARGRLVRQVLTESAAMAAAGGVAGLVLAAWAVRGILALTPQAERLPPVPIGTPAVFVFVCLASALTAALFGVVPAWHFSAVQLATVLREGVCTLARGRRWLLPTVVSIEIALAVTLLCAAGLVTRSYAVLSRVDLGFDPGGVVAFQVPRTLQGPAGAAFYDELLRRLDENPEVRSAGLIQALPLRSSGMGGGFLVEGRTGDGANVLANWRVVSPRYFETLAIPLREGRSFDRRDTPGAERVAIVTESFARVAWSDGRAIGRRISWGGPTPLMTVVGVVADIRLSRAARPVPHVYMPFEQVPERLPQDLVVKSNAPAAVVIDVVRRTVASMDRDQPVAGVATMDGLLTRSMGRRRFQLALFALFAGAAVVLALVGLYGVLSYTVSQMSGEVGIRLALGATRRAVMWQVLRLGLGTTLCGGVAGLLLALWSGRLLQGFLFGVQPRDPLTFAAVTALLFLTAVAACALPARRAGRIDPMAALRDQ